MSARATGATAWRVLSQLRHDPGTLALLLVVPCGLLALVRYLFPAEVFARVGPSMIGIAPFVIMFSVTAVTTLRERTTGTLERLLAMPAGRLDLLAGYALTFGAVAFVQAGALLAVARTLLGLDLAGATHLLFTVAVLSGMFGMALGLFLSVFARTEFQVGQLMPAVVLPQLLLSGLFGPREGMAAPLHRVSDALPVTYAVDAASRLATGSGLTGPVGRDLAILAAAAAAALVLGAATLRRQTS